MHSSEITKYRLGSQQITETAFKTPEEMVKWLGAVQSQDYGAAKWALGLRLPGLNNGDIETAFNDGRILRTHVLRPTWHFVVPEDIRWMLRLTAPRVKQTLTFANRKLALENAVFMRSNDTIAKALEGGKHLTRAELEAALQQAGLDTSYYRLVNLVMSAELDGVICSGPRIGKQFTYALLEERVPEAQAFTREEALAELTRRYFTSHGPATVHDYAWWSGLTLAEAKTGLELVKPALLRENIDGRDYYFSQLETIKSELTEQAYLLPNYDEFTVAYKDRTNLVDAAYSDKISFGNGNPLFNNVIVIDGQVAGLWKGKIGKKTGAVSTTPFRPFNGSQQETLQRVTKRYLEFNGL